LKQKKQKSKFAIDDEIKKKKKEEEKSTNKYSRCTDQRTCSIERVIELKKQTKVD
jgi:hypothetical protein